MNKQIKGPAGDVFTVLPASLPPSADGSEEWWVDLVELDLNPPIEPTGDDELLRLDLMGDLQLMAFNDMICRNRSTFAVLLWPFQSIRLRLIRALYNRRLRRLGYRLIPRSFQPLREA